MNADYLLLTVPQIVPIYALYGLAFFTMGVAILSRLLPAGAFPDRITFAAIGVFGLLHGISEWLIAVRYLIGANDVSLTVWIQLTAVLSFAVLSVVPLTYFFANRVRAAVFLAALVFGLCMAGYVLLSRIAGGLEIFEQLYRWILGVPAVLGTAVVLWQQYRALSLHSAGRRGLLAGAVFFVLYGIFTSFAEPSAVFPGTAWNTVRFKQLVGVPVPVLRSVCALGIMVSVVYVLQRLQFQATEESRALTSEMYERAARNERMLTTLMTNIPGMVYRCLNDENWTIIYASDGSLDLTGYHPNRFLSGEVLFNHIIHPDDRNMVRQVVDANLRRHKPYTIKYRIIDSSGREKWVWEQGRAVFLPETAEMVLEGFISDITAMHRAQLDLEASEQKYRTLVELAQAGVWSVDATGVTDYVNRRMANMLGRHPRDLIGHKFFEFVQNKQDIHDWTLRTEWLQGQDFHRVEYELKTASGQTVYALFEVSVLYDEIGRYSGAIAFVLDITEQKHNQQKLQYLAEHDTLTGFYNRHYLFEQLRQLQESKNPPSFALLFIDFDRFKQVNDVFGHYAGDILLREAAARMMSQVRGEDLIARIGGDEFAILMRSSTNGAEVAAFASRLIDLFRREFWVETEKIYCSISIGIAFFPGDADNVVQLVKHADRAMYWSKSVGKNTYQFFSPEMSQDSESRHHIETELRTSLEQNTLEVFYQPQIDLKNWTVRGLEALCRLRDSATGHYISPDRFIAVAEESELIHRLGRRVLEKALSDLKNLQQVGFSELAIAVNLSARQLQSGHLVDDLRWILSHSQIDPRFLELEITESTAMSNPESGEKILQQLHTMGISMAIDDFGTGYSSLAYLQRFPVAHLKIDRTFIRELPYNNDHAAIVRSMIHLGHSLNMMITAEGVENFEQLKFLRESGCDFVQGFYFAPALSLDKLMAFLQEPVSPAEK